MQMRGKESRPPSAANKSELQPRLINTVAYQEACFIALDGNDCVYLSLSDKALEATSHGKQERKYANAASNARNATAPSLGQTHNARLIVLFGAFGS